MDNKPLQPTDIQISPEDAHKTTEMIGTLMKEVTLRVFEIGSCACKMLESKGWKYNFDDLNSYISSLGFGRKTFFNYVRLHRLWKSKISKVIDRPNCTSIFLHTPYSKLLMVAHRIESAETHDEIEQVLHDANKLSASDLAIAYGKAKPVLRFTDGNPYRITNKSKGRYDITISDCRIIWTQADGQVWLKIFKSGGRVKGQIQAMNPDELEEE